jgi:hypothetical protein
MTYHPNPTACLISIGEEMVAVFDDLPQPEVLGETLVKLLRQGGLGENARKHFQEIVQAEWEWSELSTTKYNGPQLMGLAAEMVPFFRSGNKVTRSESAFDDRGTWG